MNQFFLRREPFGGVIYYSAEGRLKFLNHAGFEICFGLAQGWVDDEIVAYIESRFQVDDARVVRSDIKDIRVTLLHSTNWKKRHAVAIGADASEIPTLSAPLEIHWEITGKCNLKCLHCYNDSIAAGAQPSLEQIRSVVDELKAAKIKMRGIIVSGGEPLMHPRLREILELIRPLAAEVVLATNGTLVTESNIGWIGDMIDVVNLSVDSSSSENFAQFRGHPQVLDKVLNAMRLFRKHGTPVVAQTTVSRYNIDALDDLAVLLKSEGAASWIVRMPLSMGRARAHEQDFLTWPEAEAKEPVFQRIKDTYTSEFDALHIGNRFMWSYEEPFAPNEQKTGLVSCAAGTMLATIRSDGTMVPCALFGNTANPKVHSLPVWNGQFLSEWRNAQCFKTMRGINLARITPCSNCSKLPDVCDGGCRALAFNTFGSVYGPDPGCNYVRTVGYGQSLSS
jgi:radical SAM protein with 4Fe4S-binding SPASM domain